MAAIGLTGEQFKTAGIVAAATGFASAASYLLYKQIIARANEAPKSQLEVLKDELLKELKQFPIEGPKDDDKLFTKDFMAILFKMLFTYQTIGREMVKECKFVDRIECLKQQDMAKYQ